MCLFDVNTFSKRMTTSNIMLKKQTFFSYFNFLSYFKLPLTRALRDATKLALSGQPIYNGISEQALTTHFELLNLVPSDHPYHSKINANQAFTSKLNTQSSHHEEKRSTTNTKGANVISATKWRRVGLVSASSVQLDTIVWPGGDIVVSGRMNVLRFCFDLFI